MNVYPEFFIFNPEITPEDLMSVRRSWVKITDGTCLNFKRIRCQPPRMFDSGQEWFGETFYEIFFEVHPAAVFLFDVNISRQARLLVRMVTGILEMFENTNDIHILLIDLTVKHSKYGVHAIQYGIFCSCLLTALKLCLMEEFTDYIKASWTKVRKKMN